MKDPQTVSEIIEHTFEKIRIENMQDIPILNARIHVQALGFQEYQGRIVGVIITPWLMNLILIPADEDNWVELSLGQKQTHKFPSGEYKFLVNELDNIGFCQTHSLFSPMNNFVSQEQAVVAAENFLNNLFVVPEPNSANPVDEELLGRIRRGEETPDLDDFATIEPYEKMIPVKNIIDTKVPQKKKFDRRSLLRGSFIEEK